MIGQCEIKWRGCNVCSILMSLPYGRCVYVVDCLNTQGKMQMMSRK